MAELVKIAQARGETRTNAIFFHGLGGDARTTWQPTYTKESEASLWLEWLAEDIEGVSVYSISYEAALTGWQGSVMELSDRATNVLNLLLLKTDLRAGEVILAGHSFGGLVIKQLLRKAADEAADEAWRFIERIRKVAFFATPHGGADLASWSDWLRILTRPSAPRRLLPHNDSHFRDLNLWYRTWTKQRGIDHLILTETRATSTFGGIIRPDNSDPGLATHPIPIDSDHIQIVKPINRESETYQLVRNFIMRRTEQPVLHEEKDIDAVKDDTQAIRENVDRLTAELCMNNAQREALVGKLAMVKAVLGGTVGLVSGYLETMLERKIQPEQIAATFSRIASHWRENIDALSFSGNLSPRLSALRDQAKAAHDAGRLDESENLVAEITRAESRALKRLADHAREILEDNEEITSRRSLYIMIMAAIIIVGMVGIGASFGYRSSASPPPEIATISENGLAKPQPEKTNRSDVPTPDASILGAAPQPSPGTAVNNVGQPVDPLQPRETMPAAGIAASPEQIETQVEPSSQTAPIEPEKMNTASVERHDALLSTEMPPRATAKIVPLPVPRPAAVAKALTPKTAARVAMPRSGLGAALAPPLREITKGRTDGWDQGGDYRPWWSP
jgi:pimeloyl-ACP methyl ester carboxylesterase